jgi:hypothetical protein
VGRQKPLASARGGSTPPRNLPKLQSTANMPKGLYCAKRVVMVTSLDRPALPRPRGRAGLGTRRLTSKFAPLTDIACVVSGSGRFVISGCGNSKEPARTPVDPLRLVTSIAYNRAVHFLTISDSADRPVPAGERSPFTEKLRQAGRSIPQYFVTATDDFHPSVVSPTELVTAGCRHGKSDARITTVVGTLVVAEQGDFLASLLVIGGISLAGTARPSAEPRASSPTHTGGKRA